MKSGLALVLLMCLPLMVEASRSHSHTHTHSHAHVHGKAELDVAFEGKKGRGQLHLPGDTAFGFERRPRNPEEQEQQDQILRQMRAEESSWLSLSSNSSCELEVDKAMVEFHGGHSDLIVHFQIPCADEIKRVTIELEGLFSLFPRLERVQVQAILGEEQKGMELRRETSSLALGKSE